MSRDNNYRHDEVWRDKTVATIISNLIMMLGPILTYLLLGAQVEIALDKQQHEIHQLAPK